MNLKISIITPSFNQGHFIEKAILSVLSQNYDYFEHIIIDGGSTDNTIDIIKKYPHLIWISEPDGGQSDAINKGFKIAKGDIIGWLNTDEYYQPEAFKIIINKFSDPKNYFEILYGNYIYKNGDNEKLIYSIPFIPKMINFRQYVNTVSLFFKKKIITDGYFINKNYHATMDKDYIARLENAGYKFKYINKTIGVFCFHENCKSNYIRNIQIKEGREIIKNQIFNGSDTLFKLLFWPVKYFYDFVYKFVLIISKLKN
jgi:Glycosyltransferases involved in cell wall biogenesis